MLNKLTTEGRNPASEQIDTLSATEIVKLMNSEDVRVAEAVSTQEKQIAQAIKVISERMQNGGRLIYIGAGTSGRLGVLDASECPPTFNTPPELVVGLIAGGRTALTQAVEGAEDYPEQGRLDLEQAKLCEKDVVVGIATSGRTPYVIGGLEYAGEVGAFPIGFCCNRDASLADVSQILIAPIVGPEVVSGSTRLKSGTATKMVLNMLTTGSMVLLGKTFGNLMVDLRATNSKLIERSKRIVSMLTDLEPEEAESLLSRCEGELKTAIVAHLGELSPQEARVILEKSKGHLRSAIEMTEKR